MFQEEEIRALFEESEYDGIAESIRKGYLEKGELDLGALEEHMEEREWALLSEIIRSIPPISEEEKTYRQCIDKIKRGRLNRRRSEILNILEILDEEEDRKQIETLTRELMDISKLMNDK